MPTQLTEGVDYTVEDGRWVFTAKFLRERGYCCGNGCRNCPYGSNVGCDERASCAVAPHRPETSSPK